uniref:Gag-pol polyprotein n=1 Tax=Solanum tuberosum TaxID=4113 RepID=M0ZP76_SOLTU
MEFVTRFRFSASRSRLDRFPISSSTESVIMHPRRANARNMNARNVNTAPPVPDQEVSNAEFRNAMRMLAQSVANQNNQRVPVQANANIGSATARVRDFVRMNPPEFLGSQCHSPSLHPERCWHSKTITGPKRTLGLTYLT